MLSFLKGVDILSRCAGNADDVLVLFFFLLFFLSASQMIYTKRNLTMAIHTDAANMQKSNK